MFKNSLHNLKMTTKCSPYSGLQCWECDESKANTCYNSTDAGQLGTCDEGITSCFKSETSKSKLQNFELLYIKLR